MLHIIGIGLSLKDISARGLEAIKNCDKVYLESYTSVSDFSIKELEEFIGKKVIQLNRKQVEEEKPFLNKNTALLVYGDPLSATTHYEISKGAEIIHAPSILTAVAETGLSLYKFGKTASIPFHPAESFFDILEQNQSIDAHTLFLLDLDPENNKFLDIKTAIQRISEIAKKRNFKLNKIVACARLGMKNPIIKYDTPENLKKQNFGKPPYCIIAPAELNFKEEESLSRL
tara:strand:- start:8688 stop:9377 length:690 start_codon:yes stop_codon:yes gene_type:complete